MDKAKYSIGGLILLLGLFITASANAADCSTYLVDNDGGMFNHSFCACGLSPSGFSQSGYDISTGAIRPSTSNSTRCVDENDTVCGFSGDIPNVSATYYFKNTTAAADFYRCDWMQNVGFDFSSAQAHIPTHNIIETASPVVGGSVSCSPNPVEHGSSANCNAIANTGYTFVGWSGDCSGQQCDINNVMGVLSVTAIFSLLPVLPVPVMTIWGIVGVFGMLILLGMGFLRRRA